jgi:CBS domain containing-hemolysin-like protein
MQLGVTLTSLAIGAIGEAGALRPVRRLARHLRRRVLAFLVITFMHVVVGELVPKGLALSYSERIALGVSVPVRPSSSSPRR